jgi:hypothetical protein
MMLVTRSDIQGSPIGFVFPLNPKVSIVVGAVSLPNPDGFGIHNVTANATLRAKFGALG